MDPWYASLAKPEWTPAPSTIGLIWTIVYPIILVTFGVALVGMARGQIAWSVAVPIGINLAANFAFTPIQFGMHNLTLAAVDIVIVLVTIVWCMVALWPYSPWYAVALLPYLVWVSTATVLQLSITFANR